MKKIDTSDWKEFRVGDLFGKANLGKYHNPESLVEDENGYDYICASNQNNGVNAKTPKVALENTQPTPSNIISWGKQCPYFTFHKNPCVAGQGMYYITVPDFVPFYSTMYLVAVLQNAIGEKFNYSNCLIGTSMDELKIKLPVDQNGAPDWAYMESYMKSIEASVSDSLTRLQSAKDSEKKKVDTTGWGKFKVGELFDIHPTKAYKCTNKELLDNGNFPVVVNSAYNNGIGGGSSLAPTEKGNMITFSDTVDANTVFYQKEPFVGYPHVQGMYPVGNYKNCWTQNSLMFFSTAFRAHALAMGFNYGNKFRRDVAINLTVELPVDQNGDPDWGYMEEYMKVVKEKVNGILNHLDRISIRRNSNGI